LERGVWGRGESRDRGGKRMGYQSTNPSPTPVCTSTRFVRKNKVAENAIFYLIRDGIFLSFSCLTNVPQDCTLPILCISENAEAAFLVYLRYDTVLKIVPIRQKETTLEQKRP
jgi:hypothetical protein